MTVHVEISGIHLEVTPALSGYVHDKFRRLERYCTDLPVQIHVTLAVDKKFDHRAEATLHAPRIAPIHASGNGSDMYVAIDALIEKLDRLMAKQKDKRHNHHHGDMPPLVDEL